MATTRPTTFVGNSRQALNNNVTASYNYDKAANRTNFTYTDALGRITAYVYDALGRTLATPMPQKPRVGPLSHWKARLSQITVSHSGGGNWHAMASVFR